jgi:hypothetical protein
MKTKNKSILLMCALFACPPVAMPAPDTDPCLTAAKAEEERITREYSARPPGPDRDAQVQWSKALHAALAGVERRVRKCEEDRRPKPGSAAFQKNLESEQQCSAKANMQIAELDRRYQGRTPSATEQRTIRDAQTRIMDERMECVRRVPR